ncbi:olfactory receptor 7D4-like [Thomomys bottae]
MEAQNETAILEFLLLGLSNDPEVEPILFGLLLSMYLITVLGNLLIILAITSDPHLHTPMYFFLSILSLADLGFISTTVPKMLVDLRNHSKSISYAGCLTQVSFFFFSGCLDSALLAVMAYDRLVAICHPLHYSLIMSPRLCGLLVLLSCFISFLDFQAHFVLVSQLTFCKRGEIRHFFCDPSELLTLACKDPSTNHILLYVFGVFFSSGPISVILYSYIRIISAIRRVQSSSGKYKAFSTCGSHLSVQISSATSKCYGACGIWERLAQTRFHLLSQSVVGAARQSASFMEPRNYTGLAQFQLLGLSDDPELWSTLVGLFLSMYLITMLGNLLIILAVTTDPHLHTPTYFFLSILSMADLGFTSTMVPKMLVNLQTHNKSISYAGCLTQVAFFIFCGCMDSVLLAVMAYDRLVAICHPLHYPIIMNPHLCGFLVLLSLFLSFLDSLLHCLMMLRLTFCTGIEIPSFFCDPSQLLKLACDYTSTKNLFIYLIGAFFGGIPASGILYSYIQIVSTVLRVPSARGKYKAFSTCGSHLSVVCLFYGTGLGAYCSSVVSDAPRKVMVASVGYTMVTPMLNPFVYSLRNKDIKRALWFLVYKAAHCPH